MIGPYAPDNPWAWAANDVNGKTLSISIAWNSSSNALQGATVVRDAGCLLSVIWIGLGPDGTPNTSTNAYSVPTGTTKVNANQLAKGGLNTIMDVTALQITAGP